MLNIFVGIHFGGIDEWNKIPVMILKLSYAGA